MREILFRGKRSDNNEWAEGFFLTSPEFDNIGLSVITEINPRCPRYVFKNTVGQYTGLTANGKKIFEGDIIRYADIDEYRIYLESLECPEDYEENAFNNMWTIDKVVYGINIGYPAFDLNNHDWEINGLSNLNESGQFYFEVIGNIHDNPELLGGGEE